MHTEGPDRALGPVLRLSINTKLPNVLRSERVFIATEDVIPGGFSHYLIFESNKDLRALIPSDAGYSILPDEYSYLGEGDVIRLSNDYTSIRALFRTRSSHNSILVTEYCNHYCLMCSQPPSDIDDSYILDEIEQLIPLIPKETRCIGFTGGEPTLTGDRFISILKLAKSYLDSTAIHILSNGRSFSNNKIATEYASIDHPDIMIGIPLYSADPSLHDYVVQSQGAFDDTMLDILNLKRPSQKVEIRVVLHKLTIPGLEALAEFITRNLLIVDHVALIDLEMMGFTRANLDTLWIDPYDYKDALSRFVDILNKSKITTSVYNLPLCVVNPDTYPNYRKSICDWKNEYATECVDCSRRSECGCFFGSAIKFGYSRRLRPFV